MFSKNLSFLWNLVLKPKKKITSSVISVANFASAKTKSDESDNNVFYTFCYQFCYFRGIKEKKYSILFEDVYGFFK